MAWKMLSAVSGPQLAGGGVLEKQSAIQGDRKSFLIHIACRGQVLPHQSHQVTHQRARDLFAGNNACGQDPLPDSTIF